MMASLANAVTVAPLKPAKEIAATLGVTPETVLAWAREGKIPSHMLSRRAIRFNPTEVYSALGVPSTPLL